MNFEMRKIKGHWIAGRFDLIGFPAGWSFYPITYKDKQYIVELKVNTHTFRTEELKVNGRIFNYGEEYKLFRKHKRNCIFSEDISVISLDNNKKINIRHATDEEIKMYLPQIIKNIFQRYEFNAQQLEENSRRLSEAGKWNGVV